MKDKRTPLTALIDHEFDALFYKRVALAQYQAGNYTQGMWYQLQAYNADDLADEAANRVGRPEHEVYCVLKWR